MYLIPLRKIPCYFFVLKITLLDLASVVCLCWQLHDVVMRIRNSLFLFVKNYRYLVKGSATCVHDELLWAILFAIRYSHYANWVCICIYTMFYTLNYAALYIIIAMHICIIYLYHIMFVIGSLDSTYLINVLQYWYTYYSILLPRGAWVGMYPAYVPRAPVKLIHLMLYRTDWCY